MQAEAVPAFKMPIDLQIKKYRISLILSNQAVYCIIMSLPPSILVTGRRCTYATHFRILIFDHGKCSWILYLQMAGSKVIRQPA